MPISARGNSVNSSPLVGDEGRDRSQAAVHRQVGMTPAHYPRRGSSSGGFTLIELMIVVVLIAVASSVASLALRDPASTTLEREGARLAALLESARAEARASGLATYWEPQTQVQSPDQASPGFRFVGLPPSEALPTHWLDSGVSAEVVGARAVMLGPEPLIGAQSIVLRLRDQRLTLATDGLGPFVVVAEAERIVQ
jgi:general secretion pathway protein H